MEIQPLGCCFDGFVLRLRLLVASMPGSPAGGRGGVCLALDQVVRCSSTSGAEFEFWRPGTLCWSPVRSTLRQLENLSVFLGFFEVMTPVFFLPLLVAPSLEAPQHGPARFCGCPLSLWPSRWQLWSSAAAADSRTGMVGHLSSPPSGVADGAVSVPLMLCAPTGIYFRSILASSRLSLVWDFSGLVQAFSCLALSVPVGVRSVFSPAGFSSLWLCLVERI